MMMISSIDMNEMSEVKRQKFSEDETVKKMHKIIVIGKRTKVPSGFEEVNVTSKGDEFKRLSPFFPVVKIDIPFMENKQGCSVEGVWQGLKVMENSKGVKIGIDKKKFEVSNMKNLKRKAPKDGKVLGHYTGEGKPLLNLVDARMQIYIPIYLNQLENCKEDLNALRKKAENGPICLRDYYANDEVSLDKPLSHASLIKRYLLTGTLDFSEKGNEEFKRIEELGIN